VVGRPLSKWTLKEYGWAHILLQLMTGKCKALVNTVMNLWVRENAGSLTRKGHISLSRTVSHGGT
jgi:hypothetical protein